MTANASLLHQRRTRKVILPLIVLLFAGVQCVQPAGAREILSDGDFDNLPVGTGPDSNQAAGAWEFEEGESFRGQYAIVETSSFDPNGTGNSLRVDSSPSGNYLLNRFNTAIPETPGHIVRANFDVLIPDSGGNFNGGAHIYLGRDGAHNDVDRGPQLGWDSRGRLWANPCGTADCSEPRQQRILADTPMDTWQHVQLDIDLVADTYDIFWSAGADPLQLIESEIAFRTRSQRVLERLTVALFDDTPSAGRGEIYFDNFRIEVLADLSTISLVGAGGSYAEDFDAALGIDGSKRGQELPAGWTLTENEITFDSETTRAFPIASSLGLGASVMNAGGADEVDRALALGIGRNPDVGILQLLADVTDSDATSLQLAFDVEAWDASTSASTVVPGEAAFDVTVEIDRGSGFEPLLDLGRVTTGAVLQLPEGNYLDGNDAANRISFDSGALPASISAGSQLRVRWSADPILTDKWVFGLDNVRLNLLGNTGPLAGDFDGNGALDIDDLDTLTTAIQAGSTDTQYDLDQSGVIDLDDRQHWITELKETWIGDANLDGLFDSGDITAVFSAGQYEDGVVGNSTWSTGDWDGDNEFDTADLIAAFSDGGYEAGARAAVSAVPEPSAALLLGMGLLGLYRRKTTT